MKTNTKEYYAVIFSSQRGDADPEGYNKVSEKMELAASHQPGFIGIESARDQAGKGITVSYWATLEDVKNWRANEEHLVAQKLGREKFYSSFKVRVCKVEREYDFAR